MKYSTTLASLSAIYSAFAATIPNNLGSASNLTRSTSDKFGIVESKSSTLNISAIANLRTAGNIQGLSQGGLDRMRSAGMIAPGQNDMFPNGNLWIGGGGRFSFELLNLNSFPIHVVFWQGEGHEVSWLNKVRPKITYTLEPLGRVSISVADEVKHGAFAAIYPDTRLEGQIYNTWGEFSVTQWSTVNVSREPWMKGHTITIENPSGCTAHLEKCAYYCLHGMERCYLDGDYKLKNCDPSTNPGANPDEVRKNGGCGMGQGGAVKVVFAM